MDQAKRLDASQRQELPQRLDLLSGLQPPRIDLPASMEQSTMDPAVQAHLMDCMDDEFVWELAQLLVEMGLLEAFYLGPRAGSEGPSVGQASRAAAPGAASDFGEPPAPAGGPPGSFHAPQMDPVAVWMSQQNFAGWHQPSEEDYLSGMLFPGGPDGSTVQQQVASMQAVTLAAAAQATKQPFKPPGNLGKQIQLAKELNFGKGGATASSDQTRAEDKKEAPMDDDSTCLIVRNLGSEFTQEVMQDWLNEAGFKNKFDFALVFPAKKTSRLNNLPYAFVNFTSPEVCREFKSQNHGNRIAGNEVNLSIQLAKRQGFVDNYLCFAHLLVDGANTQCRPFFCERALAQLPPEHKSAVASKVAAEATTVAEEADEPCTTVIVRNMPTNLVDQDMARAWFDADGFKDKYDFFLFFPGKSKQLQKNAEAVVSPGYFFVNFLSADDAVACTQRMQGHKLMEAELNVVASRKQGLAALKEYFSSICEQSKTGVKPWFVDMPSDRGPQPLDPGPVQRPTPADPERVGAEPADPEPTDADPAAPWNLQ